MTWFAVRSTYAVSGDDGSKNTYCERVVLFDLAESDDLLGAAETESTELLSLNPHYERIGEFCAFQLGAHLETMNGAEVWCNLFEGPEGPQEFLAQRYESWELEEEVG